MSQKLILIIAIVGGLLIVLIEKWYSKFRTGQIKEIGKEMTPKYGYYPYCKGFSDYERTVKDYAVALVHIPKSNFYDRHALRLIIDFNWEASFEDLEAFASKQKDSHPQYSWAGNAVFYDIKFYQLKQETLNELEEKLNKIIELLKSYNLEPIERKKARKIGEDFDNWQMSK